MKRGYQADGINVNAPREVITVNAPTWAALPIGHGLMFTHFDPAALFDHDTLPLWTEARKAAQTYFAECVDHGPSYHMLCRRNDGRVQLWAWYPNGHQRRVWCFGTPRGAA